MMAAPSHIHMTVAESCFVCFLGTVKLLSSLMILGAVELRC